MSEPNVNPVPEEEYEMIVPSVGRVVLYIPGSGEDVLTYGNQPLSATVAAVIDDRCVNLSCADAHGVPFNRVDVQLVQPGDDRPDDTVGFCYWMPYQLKTANDAKKPDGGGS